MLKKQYCTPGPKYSCPTTIGYEKTDVRLPRAPAFSLGQRIQSNSATYRSQPVPGPKYDLSNVTRYGCIATPAAFLVSRIKEPKRNIPTPSPASYNIPPSVPAKPAFTLGFKRESRKKLLPTPAPNAYTISGTIGKRAANMPSVPQYSILGRSNDSKSKNGINISPGPAKYSAVGLERYKKQNPRVVMVGTPISQSRIKKTGTPAPNAYLPTLVQYNNAPKYSLGKRTTEAATPYFTAADKVPLWE